MSEHVPPPPQVPDDEDFTGDGPREDPKPRRDREARQDPLTGTLLGELLAYQKTRAVTSVPDEIEIGEKRFKLYPQTLQRINLLWDLLQQYAGVQDGLEASVLQALHEISKSAEAGEGDHAGFETVSEAHRNVLRQSFLKRTEVWIKILQVLVEPIGNEIDWEKMKLTKEHAERFVTPQHLEAGLRAFLLRDYAGWSFILGKALEVGAR